MERHLLSEGENAPHWERGAKNSTAAAPPSRDQRGVKPDQFYIIVAAAEVRHYIGKKLITQSPFHLIQKIFSAWS